MTQSSYSSAYVREISNSFNANFEWRHWIRKRVTESLKQERRKYASPFSKYYAWDPFYWHILTLSLVRISNYIIL